MLTAQKYLEIVNRRGKEGKELSRVYRNIRNIELFTSAYGKLYSNKGALTPGINPEDSIDGNSLEKMERIIETLKNGTFRWEPVRRVHIPKKSGGKRPLGMPDWTDKIVQEVIRMVLEAYYEPKFSQYSHGFRPGRGCHTALEAIETEWKGTSWLIEGDISKCFDELDHDILLEIIGKDIKDNRLIKLLKQMLQAGYMEDWKYNETLSGSPQGGVISPLLSNIYLNELDKFVEETLLRKYNRGKGERRINPRYNRLRYLKRKAWKENDRTSYKMYHHEMMETPYYMDDPAHRRLRYVRYADDFILGFAGPKSEAEEIKREIREFLKKIKLRLSEEKTLITHASTERARFLGYEIGMNIENHKRTNGRRSINTLPLLRIPRDVRVEWTNRYREDMKVVHRTELMNLSNYEIVRQYNAELYGLVNYYEKALNVSSLYKLKFVMMESLIKTLSSKNRMKVSEVYRRFSFFSEEGIRCLRVVVEREGKEPLTAEFGSKPIRYKRSSRIKDAPKKPAIFATRNELTSRLLGSECELCGANEPVEGHHINKMASLHKKWAGKKEKPAWVNLMISRNRKTLFVCRTCHVAIHNGTYDGKKVE